MLGYFFGALLFFVCFCFIVAIATVLWLTVERTIIHYLEGRDK